MSIGSNVYPVEQWSISQTNELQDVSSTASASSVDRIAGFTTTSASFSVFLVMTASALATAMADFVPGASAVCKFPVGNSAKGYTGTFLISGHTITNPAKAVCKLDVTADSTGAVPFGAIT